MKPIEREQRLKAVLKTWRSICNRRGLSQAQKDQIFEKYLITTYALGATARRDYKAIVQTYRSPKASI